MEQLRICTAYCMLDENMSLAISLMQFSFLPGFIETENGEPKKAHWLGSKPPATSQQGTRQAGPKGGPSRPSDTHAYRDLASITLGEVKDAYHFFEAQLIPSPFPEWIGTNTFCMFDLKQRRDEYRPAAIFGRVRTCHPSDGYVNNVQVMELLFPRKEGGPDIVLLRNEDIDASKPVQSYGLRVRLLASPDEVADFSSAEDLFLEQGLIPEYSTDYIDLLSLREQDRDAYPWFYVIGSRWFASIPESVKPEIRESLKSLVRWNKHVYNFTEHFLTTPEKPADAVKIIAFIFERICQQAIK